MNTMLKIKEIVAHFLKVDKDCIKNDTVIDRNAIKGSIMIHRMYAVISKELKCEIKGYDKIKTFSDLLEKCRIKVEKSELGEVLPVSKDEAFSKKDVNLSETVNKNFSIGIDMEEIEKMPKAADFREAVFYKQNFSQKEISYCLFQPDPLQSFAGKFAAKEAIVKADNSYKGIPFSQIEISNDNNGKPYFMNFAISISHTCNFVVAVAAKVPVNDERKPAGA